MIKLKFPRLGARRTVHAMKVDSKITLCGLNIDKLDYLLYSDEDFNCKQCAKVLNKIVNESIKE